MRGRNRGEKKKREKKERREERESKRKGDILYINDDDEE